MHTVIGSTNSHPDRGEKMSVNRMLYVLIVLALAVGTFFTFQQAIAAGAIARANPSYNQTEMMRGHRGGINPKLVLNEQP